MISWKLFIIYFLLTGMYLHYKVTKTLTLTEEEINELSEKKKESLEELRSVMYVNFGNINLLPILQILSLLLGWIVLPYAILSTILEKLNIKVD